MTLRQWALIEVLLLANGLAGAVGLILVLFNPTADVFSHTPITTQVVVVPQRPTVAQAPSLTPTITSTATSVPSATLVFSPSPTATLAPSQTSIPSQTPTSVLLELSATLPPTNTPAPTQPQQFQIVVVGHSQSLPLSCESRSAADLAGFFGVTIDELDFFSHLPISDNPDVGFVGDVNGRWGQIPPNAYGVYAGPVAALLQTYGLNAQAYHNLAWADAQAEIRSGRPLIVWVVGHVWEHERAVIYTAQDGSQVQVAPYEHTVLLIGYDDQNAIILDGEKTYTKPIQIFLSSWAALGNMAVMEP